MGSGRLSWLLAPWHVAALATGAKSFRDNPVIGSPALNRAGLHIARVRLAHRMAEWRRQRLSALVCKEDRAAFERDGFILKPNFLPAADYAALKEQVLSFRAPVRHQLQGDALTRRIALDRRTLANLPALHQPGVDEIRIPGEGAFRSRERALRDGIEIDRVVYEALKSLHLD